MQCKKITLKGIFWGGLVFNLDRFLVSTMKKSKGRLKEVIQIFPRLLLAIFLAIVISKPLELKIFEQEVNEKLQYTGATKLATIDSLYNQKITYNQNEISKLKSNIDKRFELARL